MEDVLELKPELRLYENEDYAQKESCTVRDGRRKRSAGRTHLGSAQKSEDQYRIKDYVQEYDNNARDSTFLNVSYVLKECLENRCECHEDI